MDHRGVCVVILVFSECVCWAQNDRCWGREPVVDPVGDGVMSCSVPVQNQMKVSAAGCRLVPGGERISCYLRYEDGAECEKRLDFSKQQEALECEVQNRLISFHVRVKRTSSQKAEEPSASSSPELPRQALPSKPLPVVGLHLGLFAGYTLTDDCPIKLSHNSLLVEYGQHVEVNCILTNKATGKFLLGWETTVGEVDPVQGAELLWKVTNLTLWDVNNIKQLCYLIYNKTKQCRRSLQITLYKRPDSVMIHPEPGDWSENEERKLNCTIKGVGPEKALIVQWTKVDQNTRTITHHHQSRDFFISRRVNEEVDVTHILIINTSLSEDGVQYQCAALLNLTQLNQTQVGVSQPFKVTVLYKPIITQPSADTLSTTTGDVLVLNCAAHGNPEPQYTWTTDHSNISHSSVLNISNIQSQHQGNFTCIASNSKGSVSVSVMVIVSEDTLPVIASCAAVAVALLIVGLSVWYCTHYRHTHMGQYILKNLTSRRQNTNMAHTNLDQREL